MLTNGRHICMRELDKSVITGWGLWARVLPQILHWPMTWWITALTDIIQNCQMINDVITRGPEWHVTRYQCRASSTDKWESLANEIGCFSALVRLERVKRPQTQITLRVSMKGRRPANDRWAGRPSARSTESLNNQQIWDCLTKTMSDSSNSSRVRYSDGYFCFRARPTKWRIQATTLTLLRYEENRLNHSTSGSIWTDNDIIFASGSCSIGTTETDMFQVSTVPLRKTGPDQYNRCLTRSEGNNALEAQFAGFSADRS